MNRHMSSSPSLMSWARSAFKQPRTLVLGALTLVAAVLTLLPPHAAWAQVGEEQIARGGLNSGGGAALFFYFFAAMTVGGALFVITRSNLISAVMGMVGTFFAIAAVYAMLYAHFLAAIQVLVYAGAIMVLFVFVIMILNKPEDEPWRPTGWLGRGVSGLLILYLLVRMGQVLASVEVSPESLQPPPGLDIDGQTIEFGTTIAIGANLFTRYVFPFEAVSLVLLIAVVGAITVARPHERPPLPEEFADAASAKDGSSGTGSPAT